MKRITEQVGGRVGERVGGQVDGRVDGRFQDFTLGKIFRARFNSRC